MFHKRHSCYSPVQPMSSYCASRSPSHRHSGSSPRWPVRSSRAIYETWGGNDAQAGEKDQQERDSERPDAHIVCPDSGLVISIEHQEEGDTHVPSRKACSRRRRCCGSKLWRMSLRGREILCRCTLCPLGTKHAETRRRYLAPSKV